MDALGPALVNFGAVVGILYVTTKKPFLQFLSDRAEGIGKAMKESEAQYKEASVEADKWEKSWNNREAYIREQREQAKVALKLQQEKIIAGAKAEAERIKKDASLMGESEMARAKAALQAELVQKSIGMATNFLETKLPAKDRQKLVGEYSDLVTKGDGGSR